MTEPTRAQNILTLCKGVLGQDKEIARLEDTIADLLAALKAALPCLRALEDTQRAMGHDYVCTAEVEQVIAALKLAEGN